MATHGQDLLPPADIRRPSRESREEPLAGLFTLTRRMENEEEEQFDVDLAIMDFFSYKATDLIFEWRAGSNPYQSDLPSALVTMAAEWRTFLKHKHCGRRLNFQVAFRSRLLQFALLFTHRLNHDQTWTSIESLDALRAQNRSRAQYWYQTQQAPALHCVFDPSHEFPLSDSALLENRHKLACSLGQPQEKRRWVGDLEATPTLHCLLPLFIELTAARVQLGDWLPSQRWMHLVGHFMLHAVIEEYLLNGKYQGETFNTIFAIGSPGTLRRPDDGSDIEAMRTLFGVQDRPLEQLSDWAGIKQQYINQLLPPLNASSSFVQAMIRAQELNSYTDFENDLISFLKYLHDEIDKPDLVQVEEGRVTIHGEELQESESRAMMHRIGL